MAINLEGLTKGDSQIVKRIKNSPPSREKDNLITQAVRILREKKSLPEDKISEFNQIGKEPDYKNLQFAHALVQAYYETYLSTYKSAFGRNKRSVQ